MKRKLLLWLAVASISTVAWATELPNEDYYINVHHTDGTIISASLDEQVILQFINDNMRVSVLEQEKALWHIDNVDKIMFSLEMPTTDIQNTIFTIDNYKVCKVLENGQVIIVKDGVRYNILGIRL